MKYAVVVFIALVALACTEEFEPRDQDDLREALKECRLANRLPGYLMMIYKMPTMPDERRFRCYIECILEKMDLFEPNIGFNKRNLIIQMATAQQINEYTNATVNMCADDKDRETDICKWAFRGYNCFKQRKITLVLECRSLNPRDDRTNCH